MAEEDVITSEIEEGQAVDSTVTMMRRAKDIVEKAVTDYNTNNNTNIDTEGQTIGAAAWALTDYALSNPGLMNNAAGLEALEAGIKGIIDNSFSGPADDQMPKIEELLNLVLAGADGMFITADTQAQDRKEKAKLIGQQNAAYTNKILMDSVNASLADVVVDPQHVQNLIDGFRRHGTPEANERLEGLAISGSDPDASPDETDDAIIEGGAIVHGSAAPDQAPAPGRENEELTPEDVKASLRASTDIMIEKIKNNSDLSEEEKLARIKKLEDGYERVINDPEAMKKFEQELQNIKDNSPELLPQATQDLYRRYSGTANFETANAVSTADITRIFAEPSSATLDNNTVQFQNPNSDEPPTNIYLGTGISADGLTLENNLEETPRYFIKTGDTFEALNTDDAIATNPNDGALLWQQVSTALEKNYAPSNQILSNLEGLGIPVDGNGEELIAAINNPETNPDIVSIFMQDEEFRNTIGTLALNEQIESQLVAGKTIVNDSAAISFEAESLVADQVAAIDELIAVRDDMITTRDSMSDTWALNYYSNEIESLNTQISEMQDQVQQFTDLEQATTNLNVLRHQLIAEEAVGVANHMNREMVEQRIAETEADIEDLKQQIIGEAEVQVAEAESAMEGSANEMASLQAQHEAMNPDFMMVTPLPGQALSPEFSIGQEYAYQADQYMDAKEDKEAAEDTIAQVEAITGDTQAAEAPAPAPNSTQALVDENPELKSYLQSLSSQHGISEADLHDELESRGLTSAQAKAVTELAETQYSVNVSPKIDTPVATNTTTAAFKGPGELLQGTFANATKVGSVEVTPIPDGPQIMGPGDNMAVKNEIANNDPTVKSTMGL